MSRRLSPFQTKGKPQTGTVLDIEKYLSTAQIQDWRNVDLQKYKVRHVVGSDCREGLYSQATSEQLRDPDFQSK